MTGLLFLGEQMHQEMKIISWPLRVIFLNEQWLQAKRDRSPLQLKTVVFSFHGSLRRKTHTHRQAWLPSRHSNAAGMQTLTWSDSGAERLKLLFYPLYKGQPSIYRKARSTDKQSRHETAKLSVVIHCNNQTTALIMSAVMITRCRWNDQIDAFGFQCWKSAVWEWHLIWMIALSLHKKPSNNLCECY